MDAKICEYCTPSPYGHGEAISTLIKQVFNDKAIISLSIFKDCLELVAYPSPEDTNLAKVYSKACLISYCPICGKKLMCDRT